VKADARRVRKRDDADRGAKSLNAKAIEKRSVEGEADSAPVPPIHVDGRLDGPLIGRARIESTGISVAVDLAVAFGDEPRRASASVSDSLPHFFDRRWFQLERDPGLDHVRPIDSEDLFGVGLISQSNRHAHGGLPSRAGPSLRNRRIARRSATSASFIVVVMAITFSVLGYFPHRPGEAPAATPTVAPDGAPTFLPDSFPTSTT
jgi:hypothetical protein